MVNILKRGKRIFTISVIVATVFSMSLLALPFYAQAATLSAGDLIKASQPAVYYYASDGKRYVFPNETTYFSWYPNFNGVKTITDDELAAISIGGNIVMRPGTNLVKITTDPKVYAVGPDGTLHWVDSETRAMTLYGPSWASMVVDVPDAFFTNYTVGSALTSNVHPDGTLFRMQGDSNTYLAENGMKRLVSDAAMAANGWQAKFVAQASSGLSYTTGTPVTGAESAWTDTAQMGGASGVVPTGGGLTVGVASNTPASANVPKSIDNILFTKLNFTAGTGSVTVTSLALHRTGLGADADISSVSLYDGATKLGTTRTSFDSDHKMIFNLGTGWTIPAGTTKALDVKVKLGTAGTYNALGIASMGDITSNASSVTGSFPMYGNQMNGVDLTANMGQITVDGQGTTSQTKKIGTTDVQLAYFSLEANSKEDVSLKSLTLKNQGTAKDSAIGSLYLKNGETVLAGPVEMASDWITFDLSANPLAINKSDKVYLKVMGDILDGDGTTVEFILKNDTDIEAIGNVYGYNVQLDKTGFDEASDGGTTATTIDGAELNVSLASNNQDVKDEVNNVEFGRLTLGVGEGGSSVKVTKIILTVDETDGNSSVADNKDVDELELIDSATGAAYSGTMTGGGDTDADDETWTFDDEIIVTGTTTLIVRGDLPSGIGDGDQYNLAMTVDTTNLVAETFPGGDAIDNYSVSSLTGKKTTVKSPTLTVKVTAMNNENYVPSATGVSLFQGRLEAGTASDIKVERMRFEQDAANQLDTANFTRAQFLINGAVQQTISSFTTGELDFNELAYTVPAGSTNGVDFDVKVDLKDTFSANKTVKIQLDTVSAKDSDNDAVTAKDEGGTAIANGAEEDTTRTVYLKSKGVLYLSMNVTDAGYNKDRYILAGNSAFVGKLKVRAEYEDIKLQDLKLSNDNGTDAYLSVSSICLYKAESAVAENLIGCTTLGSNDVAFFDDIDYVVAQGTEYFYIYVTTNKIGNGATDTSVSHDKVLLSIQNASGNVAAEGLDSGEALTLGNKDGTVSEGEIVFDDNADGTAGTFDETTDNETGDTKAYEVTGSQLTSVELVNSYSGTTVASNLNGTGTYNVAILKVTAANHSNVDSVGTALKLDLDALRFDVAKNSGTVLSAMTIERIGGVNGAKTLTNSGDIFASGKTSGYVDADYNTLAATDSKIEKGTTAYFVVKATIGTMEASVVDWIEVNLDTLDTTTSENITWKDGSSGTAFEKMLLDYSNVDGTKINEVT